MRLGSNVQKHLGGGRSLLAVTPQNERQSQIPWAVPWVQVGAAMLHTVAAHSRQPDARETGK